MGGASDPRRSGGRLLIRAAALCAAEPGDGEKERSGACADGDDGREDEVG